MTAKRPPAPTAPPAASTVPPPAPSGSGARVVRVLQAVLRHGPQRPDTLCQRTGLSRTAVHRAIHILIDEGMLRYQLGRRQVALRGDWHPILLRQPVSPQALDTVVATIEDVARGRRLQADLAVLDTQARFRMIEATDPERLDMAEPPLESDLFLAALMQFDQARVLAITTQTLKRDGGPGQAPQPEFIRRFRAARDIGYLWEPHSRELSVPLGLRGDSSLALRLWSRETLSRSLGFYISSLAEMHRIAPSLFPEIGPTDA